MERSISGLRDDSFSDMDKKYVYKIIRELGKGSFGRVCLCERSSEQGTMECVFIVSFW